MPEKTTLIRVYIEDVAWLHQLRREISSRRGQDITVADTIRLLRELYEKENKDTYSR